MARTEVHRGTVAPVTGAVVAPTEARIGRAGPEGREPAASRGGTPADPGAAHARRAPRAA